MTSRRSRYLVTTTAGVLGAAVAVFLFGRGIVDVRCARRQLAACSLRADGQPAVAANADGVVLPDVSAAACGAPEVAKLPNRFYTQPACKLNCQAPGLVCLELYEKARLDRAAMLALPSGVAPGRSDEELAAILHPFGSAAAGVLLDSCASSPRARRTVRFRLQDDQISPSLDSLSGLRTLLRAIPATLRQSCHPPVLFGELDDALFASSPELAFPLPPDMG